MASFCWIAGVHDLALPIFFSHLMIFSTLFSTTAGRDGRSYRELGYLSPEAGFFSVTGNGDIGLSSVPSQRAIPTTDTRMKIGVPANCPFDKFVKVKFNAASNETYFSGFSIDVFQMAVQRLPYPLPYDFIPYTGSYDSLVEQVHLKTFDAVVGDTAIVAKRCSYAEFTHSYAESGVQMLVLEDVEESKTWMFIKPFTTTLWALTIGTTVYNGFVVWLIERRENNYFHEGTFWHQLGTSVWFSFSMLFSQHGGELRRSLSRVVMVVWMFVTLVLMSSYTASLASTLTTQELKPRLVDVESLLRNKAKVGCDKGSFVVKYLEERLGFDPSNIKKYDYEETINYTEDLKSGKIEAAFLEVPYVKLLLAYNCKGFTTVGPTYDAGGFGFAFPKGSPLVGDFSEAIIEMREGGQMRALEDGLITESSKCLSSKEDYKNDRLGVDSFLGLFVITIGASTIALVISFFRQLPNSCEMFILEMFSYWLMHVNVPALRQHPNRNRGFVGQMRRNNNV